MRIFLRAVTIILILAIILATPVFARQIDSLRTLTSGKNALFADGSGAAVVMRVSDGKVIAMFNHDIACHQLHPPGSIFKLSKLRLVTCIDTYVLASNPFSRYRCS